MKPVARPFYRTAMVAFHHACDHSHANSESDAIQVVLSLDFGIEMLLKAILLNRDESIMNGKISITLIDALKRGGPYKQGSTIEVLHNVRNSLQHFAQYTDPATSRDYYEGVMLFVEEVLAKDLGEQLPVDLRLRSLKIPRISGIELLAPTDVLQRDVDVHDGVVAWSQGVSNSSSLGVYIRWENHKIDRLTPAEHFDYMPKTNGRAVVAYRQLGGVVYYAPDTKKRTVISETGCPTDINDEWIAAQGLAIERGIGGGVWLYSLSSDTWEQLSDEGDSAQLSSDFVVWSEHIEGSVSLVRKRLGATEPARILIPSAGHPSVSGNRVAWDSSLSNSTVHVTTIEGEELYSTHGFFPNLNGDVLAYLVKEGDDHTLVADDIVRQENIARIPGVGFPVGSGPVVGENVIYFESNMGRSLHAIHRVRFEY